MRIELICKSIDLIDYKAAFIDYLENTYMALGFFLFILNFIIIQYYLKQWMNAGSRIKHNCLAPFKPISLYGFNF